MRCLFQEELLYEYVEFRVGKIGSLEPWIKVIVYCSKLSSCQNDSSIGGSFWQNDSLLKYIMTLLQGLKDPVLPTLMYRVHTLGGVESLVSKNIEGYSFWGV